MGAPAGFGRRGFFFMKTPLLDFIPLPWQDRFLHSTIKSPWAIGGNRSGKTEVGAFKTATRLRGYCPVTFQQYPVGTAKYWGVGLDFKQTHDIMRPKICSYLGELGKDYEYKKGEQKIEMANGNQLWFRSCDSGVDKFQSQDLDGIWFDEEPPLDIFNECWIRCVDRDGQIWGTMTPLKGSAWLYNKVYSAVDDPIFQVFTMAMTDNVHVSKSAIEDLKLTMDKSELDVRVRGEFVLVFGRPALNVSKLIEYYDDQMIPPLWRGNLLPVA